MIMSTTTAAPEESRSFTPEDHQIRCLGHLEALLPALKAPVTFGSPQFLCDPHPEDKNAEILSERGRKYLEGVLPYLLDAHAEADSAVLGTTSGPVHSAATGAYQRLTIAVYAVRGLIAGGVPGTVSAHDAMIEVNRLVKEAMEAILIADPNGGREAA
jgi:hypothetical protein